MDTADYELRKDPTMPHRWQVMRRAKGDENWECVLIIGWPKVQNSIELDYTYPWRPHAKREGEHNAET